jgi:hypothetical protein
METENLVLTPEHEKVGSLVPDDGGKKDLKAQVKTQAETFELSKEFSVFLKDLWQKCEKLNELEWLRIKQSMIKSRKYFDGKQYGKVNETLQWQDFEKRPGEVNYVSNVYHSHIQTALMELSRGETNLSFTHVAKDSRRGDLIAKVAEYRYRTHRMRLMTALKKQNENLSLLLNGIAARYTFVEFKEADDQSPLGQMKRAMEGMLEKMGGRKSVMICAVCAKPKRLDTDICANCGSQEYENLEEPELSPLPIPQLEKERRAYNRYVNPDPIGLTFDLHAADFKDSAFVVWKQVVISDLLKNQYPGVKITKGIDANELKYQYAQSSNTPHQQRLDFFMAERNTKEVAEFCQAWFDPQLYGNISFKEDIKLRSGVVIPRGTKLKRIFKKGLYVARNGENILDVWDESKNDKWTVCPYVTRLGTLVGSGTSVAHDSQDIVNDLTNLKMASILQDAFAKEFVNAQYLEPENIPNDPTERAVVTNLPDGARIVGNAIDRLPPAPLSPDAYNMDSQMQGVMQAQLGTFSSSSSGMPDLKAAQQTYGGMQLLRDITVGRYYPMLAVRSDSLDKEQAYQLLLNDQQHLSMEQWQQVKGDYGAEAVEAFLKCDLREELIIAVTPESFMPEMPSQKLSKTMAFAEFIANAQMPLENELAAYVGQQFGIPSTIAGGEAARSIAIAQIDAFKEQAMAIAQELGDLPSFDLEDEMVAQIAQVIVQAANMPVSGLMDNTAAIIDCMRDWWSSDEGRIAPNVLKAAITFRVRELQEASVKETQINVTYDMMAQQPVMEMQAEQQQAAQAAAEEAELMRESKDMAIEEARIQLESQRLELENRRLDHDANERMSQRDHERQIMQDKEDRALGEQATQNEQDRIKDVLDKEAQREFELERDMLQKTYDADQGMAQRDHELTLAQVKAQMQKNQPSKSKG